MQFMRSLTLGTALIGSAMLNWAPLAQADSAPATPVAAKQDAKAATADNNKPAPALDPHMIIATVNDLKITVADVQRAASTLPPQVRQMPPQQILPLLVDQLVKSDALIIAAQKEKLQDKPDVKAAMAFAANNVLQNAYLEEKVSPLVTDDAIKTYYQTKIASQKPETEIHARHILVSSEKEAKDIIAQLKKGADFGKLAKKYSTDKGSASQNGGDLGWFKKDAMIPDFSKAAFEMKPGTFSQKPVHTQYGWHVIQVLASRPSHIPTLDEAKDDIRRTLVRMHIAMIVDQALKSVTIVQYENGKPVPADKTVTQPAKK